MISGKRIGVLGAGGQVGRSALPLLASGGARVRAFARDGCGDRDAIGEGDIEWFSYSAAPPPKLDAVLSTMPLWELSRYFDLIGASGVTRVVALSSTSLISKQDSTDAEERRLARLLATGETELRCWAEAQGVDWVILRPTMIYGRGRDHNVSSLLRFIQRFGFLVILGKGAGLRQPVHVDDVATASVAALVSDRARNRAYELSGGETLSYLELCRRLFALLGRRPRLIKIPRWLFAPVRPFHRLLPRRLRWLVPMLERMNRDMVFDHSAAARDLDFAPRPFSVTERDLEFDSARIIP